MRAIAAATSFFDSHREEILRDLFTFLWFPSISVEHARRDDVAACCSWLAQYIERMGFRVETWPTKSHPLIFASWDHAGPDRPTVLFYNHYDVQPVDPEVAWISPPFSPEVRNGQIYARGAQDNKGQCWYTLTALNALLTQTGSLPVNVKLCIEGDEEIGSPGLAAILENHSRDLAADHLLIVDVGIPSMDIPSITLGLRGFISLTVELQGSTVDLHSGTHGGIAYNPNRALVELLGSLYDDRGRVRVPGFYDDVLSLSLSERESIDFSFDENTYIEQFGAPPVGGEREFSPLESAWIRPVLEINGIGGGYVGEGVKSVIPARAVAKLSIRTVPDQVPHTVGDRVRQFLLDNTPGEMLTQVTTHPGFGQALRTSPDSSVVRAAAQAMSEVFEAPCRFIFEGASIPIAAQLRRAAGADLLLMGLGLPDDQIHAPNEHFGVDRLRLGCGTIARILEILSES